MTALHDLARSPQVHSAGWALVHFLWQGALAALALKCLTAAMRRHAANLRYWTATATLLVMPIIPLLTIWKPNLAPPAIVPSADIRSPSSAAIDGAPATISSEADRIPAPAAGRAGLRSKVSSGFPGVETWARDAVQAVERLLPWLCAFWILGVLLSGIRMFGGLALAHLVKRQAREFAGPCGWLPLIRKSGVDTPVRLLESSRISAPMVIGWLRPVVLLPSSAAGLESVQVDALLAHELAHIRRRDYLFNLMQTAVEALLFYHPAVWWVTSRIRAERECICDDAAVAMCGDLRTYVRALSEAERRRSPSKLAVAASSAPLLQRIRRLTEMKSPQPNRLAALSAGIFAFAAVIAVSAGSGLLAYVPARPDPATFTDGQSEAAIPPAQAVVPEAAQEPAVPKQKAAVATKPVPGVAPKITVTAVSKQEPEPSPQHKAEVQASHTPLRMDSKVERRVPAQNQQEAILSSVTGTVFDPTGGVIPGVLISLIDRGSKAVLMTVFSAANGSFEMAPPMSDFVIQFEFPGFQTQAITRSQAGATPLMVQMELGQVREAVTVSADAKASAAVRRKVEPTRVGGSVVAPKLLQRVNPAYPPEARDADVEGTVVVSALIDEEGRVKDPVVLSGHPLLRDAALSAVRQWQYSRALLNNEPCPMRLTIALTFKLDRTR